MARESIGIGAGGGWEAWLGRTVVPRPKNTLAEGPQLRAVALWQRPQLTAQNPVSKETKVPPAGLLSKTSAALPPPPGITAGSLASMPICSSTMRDRGEGLQFSCHPSADRSSGALLGGGSRCVHSSNVRATHFVYSSCSVLPSKARRPLISSTRMQPRAQMSALLLYGRPCRAPGREERAVRGRSKQATAPWGTKGGCNSFGCGRGWAAPDNPFAWASPRPAAIGAGCSSRPSPNQKYANSSGG